MVICLDESSRQSIEANGMTIIECKRKLYDIADEITGTIADLTEKIFDIIRNIVDTFKFFFEEVKEKFKVKTSFRYKFVKIVSKCTGIDVYKLWVMTRHTYLARCNI